MTAVTVPCFVAPGKQLYSPGHAHAAPQNVQPARSTTTARRTRISQHPTSAAVHLSASRTSLIAGSPTTPTAVHLQGQLQVLLLMLLPCPLLAALLSSQAPQAPPQADSQHLLLACITTLTHFKPQSHAACPTSGCASCLPASRTSLIAGSPTTPTAVHLQEQLQVLLQMLLPCPLPAALLSSRASQAPPQACSQDLLACITTFMHFRPHSHAAWSTSGCASAPPKQASSLPFPTTLLMCSFRSSRRCCC
jgi:hypothetical protein